jgi:hypothetical protein
MDYSSIYNRIIEKRIQTRNINKYGRERLIQ